jgi:hypothetical protein
MTIFIILEPQYTAWKEMGITTTTTTTLYAKLAAKNSESRRIEPHVDHAQRNQRQ